MAAWIGLGSAEGVQPANGTPMRPSVESVVRWQTKANMDITLEHPPSTKIHSSEKEKERRVRRERDQRGMGKKTINKKQEKILSYSSSVGWCYDRCETVCLYVSYKYGRTRIMYMYFSPPFPSWTWSIKLKNRWSGSCTTWHKNSRCCPLAN